MTDRSRTKILVPLGLACVLIVATLTLWRPVGYSSRIPPPEREIHFPEDRSIGKLSVRDWSSDWRPKVGNKWSPFGEAQGTVTVPFGKVLRLKIDVRPAPDLSPLVEIGEHDLQSLDLSEGTNSLSISLRPDGTYRRISSSTITDSDLQFIRHLRSLRTLNLTRAKISDAGIAYLSGLTSLENLSLGRTDIGDAAMKHIGNLSSISVLSIIGTYVTDKGLAELKRLPLLRRLFLSNNPHISDAGLLHLQSLSRLDYLSFYHTPITDVGLTYLYSIRSLKKIVLVGTQTTPNGLASLRRARPDLLITVAFTMAPTPTPTPLPPIHVPVS